MNPVKKRLDLGYIFRYYWFFIAGGVALLAAVVGICVNLLVREPEPDYTVALMCGNEFSEEQISDLQALFERKAEDLNGDGRAWVQIDTYLFAAAESTDDENELNPYKTVANTVWFRAELSQGKSALYLVRPYTYETLQNLETDFFVPISEERDVVPMSELTEDEAWRDYEIALHIPNNRAAVNDSMELLQRLLEP